MQTTPRQDDIRRAHEAESRLKRGDLEGARELFRALARRVDDAGIWLRLAEIDAALGQPDRALHALGRAAAVQPRPWQASARIAELFFELGRPDRSLALLEREAARQPGNERLQLLLAQAHEDAGQREAAVEAYQTALRARPGWPAAMGGLLGVARDELREDWLEDARRMLAAGQLDADERAVLGYALGRALERRGDYDGAFDAWRRANELRRRLSGGLDRKGAQLHAERQIERYNPELLARRPELEQPEQTPVFIVGMPRSGTTLLERMLGTHPEAAGYGELPVIGQIARALEQSRPEWPGHPQSITEVYPVELLQDMVYRFFEEIRRRGSGEPRFVIDKAPLNFFQAGLISQLFPQARIIVCERDPRDVCLSIFSENFAADQAFSTDLDDLVFFYRRYRGLVEHWKRALPDRVRSVSYETLVDSPEATLRPLLEWIGMPWDDACLDFHTRTGDVATPSRWQVRQPIYRSSIGRWRNFRPHIAPLLKAFGDEAEPSGND
ncbi:MAG: sulfotransferase [Wenzhouxiangella sp.]|nr:sulfotransferase [Wenzhouxiangella sp.]